MCVCVCELFPPVKVVCTLYNIGMHVFCCFQMFYLFGILLNEVSNWILKHTIKELRPHRKLSLTTLSNGKFSPVTLLGHVVN